MKKKDGPGTQDQTKDPGAAAGPWGLRELQHRALLPGWPFQDKGWDSTCKATHSNKFHGAVQVISTRICDSLAVWTAVPYNSARRSNVLILPLEKQNKQRLWLKLCFHCQMLFLQYIFGSHWWMIDTFNLKFHYCQYILFEFSSLCADSSSKARYHRVLKHLRRASQRNCVIDLVLCAPLPEKHHITHFWSFLPQQPLQQGHLEVKLLFILSFKIKKLYKKEILALLFCFFLILSSFLCALWHAGTFYFSSQNVVPVLSD